MMNASTTRARLHLSQALWRRIRSSIVMVEVDSLDRLPKHDMVRQDLPLRNRAQLRGAAAAGSGQRAGRNGGGPVRGRPPGRRVWYISCQQGLTVRRRAAHVWNYDTAEAVGKGSVCPQHSANRLQTPATSSRPGCAPSIGAWRAGCAGSKKRGGCARRSTPRWILSGSPTSSWRTPRHASAARVGRSWRPTPRRGSPRWRDAA